MAAFFMSVRRRRRDSRSRTSSPTAHPPRRSGSLRADRSSCSCRDRRHAREPSVSARAFRRVCRGKRGARARAPDACSRSPRPDHAPDRPADDGPAAGRRIVFQPLATVAFEELTKDMVRARQGVSGQTTGTVDRARDGRPLTILLLIRSCATPTSTTSLVARPSRSAACSRQAATASGSCAPCPPSRTRAAARFDWMTSQGRGGFFTVFVFRRRPRARQAASCG